MNNFRVVERAVTENIFQNKQAVYRDLPVLPGTIYYINKLLDIMDIYTQTDVWGFFFVFLFCANLRSVCISTCIPNNLCLIFFGGLFQILINQLVAWTAYQSQPPTLRSFGPLPVPMSEAGA